jgi:CRP-like cAMP-binding protein
VGDVTVRLARYLLEEEQRADGPAFRLPVSKGELARLLNMNQATLSRCLRRLAEEGLLGMDGKRIHIPDREALRLRAFPPSL